MGCDTRQIEQADRQVHYDIGFVGFWTNKEREDIGKYYYQ